MPKRLTIAALAEKCADAYSTDQYGGKWNGCVTMLRARGYSDLAIEAVLRSKWTRWAADASGKPYGRNSARDLARFLDETPKVCSPEHLESLVRETFPGEQA